MAVSPRQQIAMRSSALPFLVPGETIQAIFPACTAVTPLRRAVAISAGLAGLIVLIGGALIPAPQAVHHELGPYVALIVLVDAFLFGAWFRLMQWRLLVVTPRRILVMRSFDMGWRGRTVRAELPRSTRFGPVSGDSHVITVENETLRVGKDFLDAVELADMAGALAEKPAD
jgi:hypothetical protein